ncbi:hypothetical protein EVAR_95353_1 [Eumeta japonica]|uniref:Uncharacterized protein n=1 Tax=Eumeta variegata TaxID=151549 RepID=A0A4C1U994_EUMVA|nr:hypothetical protein EVAR_95353_1 [Eumeta japonica]
MSSRVCNRFSVVRGARRGRAGRSMARGGERGAARGRRARRCSPTGPLDLCVRAPRRTPRRRAAAAPACPVTERADGLCRGHAVPSGYHSCLDHYDVIDSETSITFVILSLVYY